MSGNRDYNDKYNTNQKLYVETETTTTNTTQTTNNVW